VHALVVFVLNLNICDMKFFPFSWIAQFLELFWMRIFPGIIVLCLADSNKPNMDKLYFYVHHLDKCLKDSQDLLNALTDNGEQGKQLSYKTYINFAHDKNDNDDDDEENSADDLEIPLSDGHDDLDDDESSLGLQFISSWNKRREKLVHPYSVNGWMLSPISEVYLDAKKHTGSDRQMMETLFIKLFTHETAGSDAKTMSEMLDKFWKEYECYLSKTTPYNRDHIWLSSDLQEGCSYMWHKKNSLAGLLVLSVLKFLELEQLKEIGVM